MIVRNPTAAEVEKAADVASKAFPNLTPEHWQASFGMVAEVFGTRFILVVEDGGEIVSTLLCQPAPVYINETLVSHASAGAVATLPEHRCKGCAGAMMAETVKLLRKEGICLSSLWPFSFEYYRKFGWEIAAEIKSYTGQAKVFPEFGDASKVRAAREGDLDLIMPVYEAFASNFNCLTQRSKTWWSKVVKMPEPLRTSSEPDDDVKIVIHETKGNVDGYAAYKVYEAEGVKSIDCREIAFFDRQHRRDMLAYLAQFDPEGNLTFIAPPDDLFFHEIPNPRVVRTGVSASFQLRVCDPERAMQALVTDEEVSGHFTLSINDPVFKHGFEFGVEIDEGEVSTGKPRQSDKLEMDVMTLAKLYSGYLTAFEAWELGKIKASENAMEGLLTAMATFSPLTPFRSWLEPG